MAAVSASAISCHRPALTPGFLQRRPQALRHSALPSPALSLRLTPLGARASGAGKERAPAPQARAQRVQPKAQSQDGEEASQRSSSRREIILMSSSTAVLASLFNFSGTRPNYLGVDRDPPSLALCPRTPNCIATSEEFNDPGHYVPPWTYNPEDGRGRTKPVSQDQAMEELVTVVTSTKPDGFEPKIIEKRKDYLYVEYSSPLVGFTDDVEFWFPPGSGSRVEYRSASRLGESDFDINRKRIKALRKELEKYGWESTGY